MTPRLEACYFASDPVVNNQMERMARVLEYSARLHCPDWTVNVRRIPVERQPPTRSKEAHVANTQKLEYWNGLVQGAAEGECILLIDTDMVITRPLDALWAEPFDLAYTLRDSFMYPFNGGVVALRVSPAVQAFVARWANENQRMLADRTYHKAWQAQFGGINQAAFGRMLALHDASPLSEHLHLRTLPCVEWNCEDSAWKHYDPDLTRIVHLKGRLRRAVFTSTKDQDLAPLVARWKGIEAEALAGKT